MSQTRQVHMHCKINIVSSFRWVVFCTLATCSAIAPIRKFVATPPRSWQKRFRIDSLARAFVSWYVVQLGKNFITKGLSHVIQLSKLLPAIFADAMAENADSAVTLYEGTHENPELIWSEEIRHTTSLYISRTARDVAAQQK